MSAFILASVERFDVPDADVVFAPEFFGRADSNRLLAALDETTTWRQERVTMYGRTLPIPRLTAWHGDPGTTYTYSEIAMEPEPWTEPLLEIKAAVEQEAGGTFNSVLLNLYRDGNDSVAWHSDDEPELGVEPLIASVSLGATRSFQLRHQVDETQRIEVELTHGSLLVMRGPTQRCWKHQVPKTALDVGPRFNLTFRTIE